MKVNRYEKAGELLSIIRRSLALNVLFTDEKFFTVNLACNSQNNKQLLRRGHQTSQKASVKVRSKTPLVFVEENVKINAKYYQNEILSKLVVPWASKHFGSQNWTFQQDWAPAHGANTTVELCR
uniref:DDE_Tnp_ISL3 domain-containing protein n=1 Tax=Heterorhabditis bacteriophora TaxID=37862 RepID=A0A1I7WR36_HETBA